VTATDPEWAAVGSLQVGPGQAAFKLAWAKGDDLQCIRLSLALNSAEVRLLVPGSGPVGGGEDPGPALVEKKKQFLILVCENGKLLFLGM
jgi:hypothetical protein